MRAGGSASVGTVIASFGQSGSSRVQILDENGTGSIPPCIYGNAGYGLGLSAAAASTGEGIKFYAGGGTIPGTERMRITKDGNVGIGTTGPGYKLDVYGGLLHINDRGNGMAIFLDSAPWDHLHLWVDGTTSYIDAGGAETGLQFRVLSGGSVYPAPSYTTVCTMTGDGRVGIGTASPSQPLDVNGSVRVRGNLYNADGSQGYVQMSMGSTTIPGYLAFYKADNTRVGYIGWQYDSVNLVLQVENGFTGYVVNGNLGVGVSPSHKLDVNGNINASSSYYIKSVNMTRKMIGNLVNINSTSYNYTNFGAGYNNAYNFTYTRVNQGSTIEVIAFVQCSHAVGANGTMSHFQVTPRIVLQNPGGSQQITSAPVSWVRIDNSFFEITNMKEIYFTLTDGGTFLTTGQTMTVYVQVSSQNNSGATGRFGLNLWGETTVITINEYF